MMSAQPTPSATGESQNDVPASSVADLASPTESTFSVNSSGRTSFQSHARTMSILADASAPTRSNRFSLQFPIQTSRTTSPTRSSLTLVRDSAVPTPEPEAMSAGPTDGNFLTAIAAQERRVLELKDELQRAEAHLGKLKTQWTEHEAKKKREGAKRMTQLQPLQIMPPSFDVEDDTNGSNAWMQQEMERRKALLSGGKVSNRTVFSGSRHTRALSLLSPKDGAPSTQQSSLLRKDNLHRVKEHRREDIDSPERPSKNLARASTMPNVEQGQAPSASLDLNRLTETAIDGELILRTGKKMATDLKDGLWTFWEDLRQATVGEEATQILPPRRKTSSQMLKSAKKQSSRSSLRPSSRGSSIASKASSQETKRPSPARKSQSIALPDLADPSFWSDRSPAVSPELTPAPKKKNNGSLSKSARAAAKAAAPQAETDSWDAWDDSPEQSRSSSAFSESGTIPSTIPSSPTSRDSREMARKDPIPWPALQNLTPQQLKRTASNLMKEWERSLTPSPGHDWSGDYLGAGAQDPARNVEGSNGHERFNGHDLL